MESIQSIIADEIAEASMADTFEYGPHRLGPHEIRVLILMPDHYQDDQNDIHCYMLRLDLGVTEQFGLDKHPFIALSYVWGSDKSKKTIYINGRKKEVTHNLYDALFHIREILSPVPLWVDAVCINQVDEEEKTLQLKKMTTIYSQASTVLVWLGPADGTGLHILDVLHGQFKAAAERLSSVEEMRTLLCQQEEHRNDNAWDFCTRAEGLELSIALWTLFSSPVWRRVWIMQELVLAGSDAFLLWGRDIINFKVMDELAAGLPKMRDQFRPVNPYFDDTAVSLTRFAMGLQVINLRFKKVRLLEAMVAVRYRLATIEHDYLYGILGFVDGADHIKPDYNTPVQDVFLDVFDAILEQESSLDVLSTCDRGWQASSMPQCAEDEEWPTWLPDWAWRPVKQLLDEEVDGRMMFQSHIRSLLLDTQIYTPVFLNACGKKQDVQAFRNGRQLTVRGIEYDTVKEIIYHEDGLTCEDPDTDEISGAHTDFWVDIVKAMWDQGLLRHVYENIDVLKHACERTARYGHPTNSLIVKHHYFMKAFDDSTAEERLESGLDYTKDDIPRASEPFDEDDKIDKTPEPENPNSIISYMSIGTSKSSYCITQRGYLSRSPMPPQVGDKICVFYGAKVPFLLRPQANSSYFKLAGEIYIHGIMKGAAIEAIGDNAKDFILI